MLDVVARFGAAQQVTEFAYGVAGLFELGLESIQVLGDQLVASIQVRGG